MIDISTFILWIYCEICNCQRQHKFVGDDGIFETYACSTCGRIVRYAVK